MAASLGYVPNAIAQSLITRRSEMVAVIVTGFTLQTNPAIVAGIGRALAGHGKQLLLMAVDGEGGARDAAQAALRYPLDGLVLATTLDAAAVRPFLRRGVPVVCFNRPAPLPRVDRVATDHAGAARDVAGLLHAAGHRQFLCVGGPPGWPVNAERTRGFLERLAEWAWARFQSSRRSSPMLAGARRSWRMCRLQVRRTPCFASTTP